MYAIDDHMIDSLNIRFRLVNDGIKEEWETGSYEKINQCPGVEELKLLVKIHNMLVKAYYLPEYVNEFTKNTTRELNWILEEYKEARLD